MRRVCSLIAGIVTAFTLTGCSETPPETGTVPFKGTQNPAIDALRENMSKNVAGGMTAAKTGTPAKAATETKAATGATDAEKKKD